jgi:hypothetical protein
MPRLLLDHYIRPEISRMYLYEMVNQRPNTALTDDQQHFGEKRNDWTSKPSFDALRNLFALCSDPGVSFDPVGLAYTATAGGAFKQLLLEKRDSTHLLLLWRDVSVWNPTVGGTTVTNTSGLITPAPLTVTVSYGSSHNVQVFRPSVQSAAVSTSAGAVSKTTVSVAGDVTVLKIS